MFGLQDNSIYHFFKQQTLNESLITINYNQHYIISLFGGKLIRFPKHVLLLIYHLKQKSNERLNNMSHIWKLILHLGQKKIQ